MRDEAYKFYTGVFAGLAWAILAPIAIGSSLSRHLIPQDGLWFEIHRYLNTAVAVCTIIAFGIAYAAIGGAGLGHFESLPGAINKHKIVGLIAFVMVPCQALGGFLRPHALDTDDTGAPIHGKSQNRRIWEVAHRSFGFLLLIMAWFQVHSGLSRYSELYSTTNMSFLFWIVALIIMVPATGAFAHKHFMEPQSEDDNLSPDAAMEEHPQMARITKLLTRMKCPQGGAMNLNQMKMKKNHQLTQNLSYLPRPKTQRRKPLLRIVPCLVACPLGITFAKSRFVNRCAFQRDQKEILKLARI